MWHLLALIAAWFRRVFTRAEQRARELQRHEERSAFRAYEAAETLASCARSEALAERTSRIREESDRLAHERRHRMLAAVQRVRDVPKPMTRGILVSLPEDE